jgi:beta-lactamase regulating signal transducer with metallopeptidase domain
VRLDAANRLFLTLALASSLLVGYAVCGVVEGALVPVVTRTVSSHGWDAVFSIRLAPALMLLILVCVAMAEAGRVLARQLVASLRLAARIRELEIPAAARLLEVAHAVGLSGRVVLIGERAPVSFVHGVIRPRVVISDGLLESLSTVELFAVLEHELYHLSNLDPLKTATLHVMTAALAFVADLEPFRTQYVAVCELAADRRAMAACGTRPLAGALLKAMRGPDWVDASLTVSLASGSVLRIRVTQLESGEAPPSALFASARAFLKVLSAIALLALLALAAVHVSRVDAGDLSGLAESTLFTGLLCAVPGVSAGLLAYMLLALKAMSRPRRRASRAE